MYSAICKRRYSLALSWLTVFMNCTANGWGPGPDYINTAAWYWQHTWPRHGEWGVSGSMAYGGWMGASGSRPCRGRWAPTVPCRVLCHPAGSHQLDEEQNSRSSCLRVCHLRSICSLHLHTPFSELISASKLCFLASFTNILLSLFSKVLCNSRAANEAVM